MSRSILWSVRLGLLWLLGACAALPDVTPFDTATRELAAAVRVAGEASKEQISHLKADDETAEADAFAARHAAAWSMVDGAMTAFVRYSSSLQDLAVSANQGRQAATTLVEKVGNVATSLGWADPGNVVDLLSTTAGFIWNQIRLARSAATMEEAMSTLQPAVERMSLELAVVLDKNLSAAQAAAELRRGLIDKNQGFKDAKEVRRKARAKQERLFDEAKKKSVDEIAVHVSTESVRAELAGLDDLVAAANQVAAPYEADLARIEVGLANAARITSSSKMALSAWAVAHSQLIGAIKARKTFDAVALTEAIVELRGLVRRIKEL